MREDTHAMASKRRGQSTSSSGTARGRRLTQTRHGKEDTRKDTEEENRRDQDTKRQNRARQGETGKYRTRKKCEVKRDERRGKRSRREKAGWTEEGIGTRGAVRSHNTDEATRLRVTEGNIKQATTRKTTTAATGRQHALEKEAGVIVSVAVVCARTMKCANGRNDR
ncbi:hypothetical protein TRVL_10091 [Trypanosoma vivax]|nr:hypothetical protein TRVL_10091 [Trypanosoma vivax]